MANLVKDFCLKMLPECEADFLLTLANEYQLNPPQAVQGNKAKLLILVLRHLTSEDIDALQDEGAAKFLKLYNDLGGALKRVKPEVEEGPWRGEDGLTLYRPLLWQNVSNIML